MERTDRSFSSFPPHKPWRAGGDDPVSYQVSKAIHVGGDSWGSWVHTHRKSVQHFHTPSQPVMYLCSVTSHLIRHSSPSALPVSMLSFYRQRAGWGRRGGGGGGCQWINTTHDPWQSFSGLLFVVNGRALVYPETSFAHDQWLLFHQHNWFISIHSVTSCLQNLCKALTGPD